MRLKPRDVPLPPADEINLTRVEACRLARISLSTFDRAVMAGRLRIGRSGRKIVVRREELERFLSANA